MLPVHASAAASTRRQWVPLPQAHDAMKTPKGLQPLIDDGVIDEVLRPLKSGKEASVYVVRVGDAVVMRCTLPEFPAGHLQTAGETAQGHLPRTGQAGPGHLPPAGEAGPGHQKGVGE